MFAKKLIYFPLFFAIFAYLILKRVLMGHSAGFGFYDVKTKKTRLGLMSNGSLSEIHGNGHNLRRKTRKL